VTQNSASTTATTPPTITINGDNPAMITVGDSYADLRATVSDTGPGQAGDTNLGLTTFLNGTLVSNIVIDTSEVATDTIDSIATDTDGLTATSTRTVLIEAAASTTDVASRTNREPRYFISLWQFSAGSAKRIAPVASRVKQKVLTYFSPERSI